MFQQHNSIKRIRRKIKHDQEKQYINTYENDKRRATYRKIRRGIAMRRKPSNRWSAVFKIPYYSLEIYLHSFYIFVDFILELLDVHNPSIAVSNIAEQVDAFPYCFDFRFITTDVHRFLSKFQFKQGLRHYAWYFMSRSYSCSLPCCWQELTCLCLITSVKLNRFCLTRLYHSLC